MGYAIAGLYILSVFILHRLFVLNREMGIVKKDRELLEEIRKDTGEIKERLSKIEGKVGL